MGANNENTFSIHEEVTRITHSPHHSGRLFHRMNGLTDGLADGLLRTRMDVAELGHDHRHDLAVFL